MPWFDIAVLIGQDPNAVFAYLKSLKPIQNKVPESVPPPKQYALTVLRICPSIPANRQPA